MPSFSSTLARWRSTVLLLITRDSAISSLVRPSAINLTISCSRRGCSGVRARKPARRGPPAAATRLSDLSDLDQAVRVEHELLGRALVEVLVAVRRLVQRDHRGVDRLRDLRAVVED